MEDNMSNLPLYKLCHSDKPAYEKQYNDQFNNDDTIHINIPIKGNEALYISLLGYIQSYY